MEKIYVNESCNGWATNIVFYAAQDGDGIYREKATELIPTISQAYIGNTTLYINEDGEWDEIPDYQYDWPIIQVDRDLTRTCFGFGLKVCTASNLQMQISLIGYPVDKGGYQQWKSSGIIYDFDNQIMRHTAYNVAGCSGGPLSDSGYLVRGINNHVQLDPNGAPIPIQAGGTTIFSGLFDVINLCREQSKERWD